MRTAKNAETWYSGPSCNAASAHLGEFTFWVERLLSLVLFAMLRMWLAVLLRSKVTSSTAGCLGHSSRWPLSPEWSACSSIGWQIRRDSGSSFLFWDRFWENEGYSRCFLWPPNWPCSAAYCEGFQVWLLQSMLHPKISAASSMRKRKN